MTRRSSTGKIDDGGSRNGDPFLVAASLSGAADAAWARAAAPYVGAAVLGGIALDPASRAAARDLVARDRGEFLPAAPLAFIDDQLASLADVGVRAGFNVRSATVEPVREAAAVCAAHDAICEVNAHCRQPELCAVGCGESLLREPERLARFVAAASDAGATTSVKVRAEVPGVDLVSVAEIVAGAGADWLHVDAMDSEPVIAEIAGTGTDTAGTATETTATPTNATVADNDGLTIVANNGVRDRESVAEYLDYGADAVSVGRPSDDPRVLSRVADAVAARTETDGPEASP